MSTVSPKEEMHEATTPPGKGQHSDGVSPGAKQNQVGTVMLFGVPIVSLVMDGKERLCLAQISSTLLKDFSYNEIHNRRVALGINCVQCTPVQLEILRRAGAMPVTSRRCGMITRREAERLCKSFLGDHAPPQLPENFAFDVYHECGWGCRGSFVPSRYNSSRAKCIRCSFCQLFFSPNKFIFHSHRLPESRYVQPDAANFNSWRRHMKLCGDPPEETNSSNSISDMATAQIVHAWEDVKAMFNGGTRKRLLAASIAPSTTSGNRHSSSSHGGSSGNNGSGKANSGGRCQMRGDSRTSSAGGTPASGHPRGSGGAHQTKKETSSSSSTSSTGSVTSSSSPAAASTSSITAQHVPTPAYNHDAPQANFLQQPSQNPFLNVANPLLSPTGRLDSIWNPAIPGPMAAAAAAAAAAGQGARQCPIPNSSSFPALPFHPLSIPWLRRPLFPFSHPFGPTLLNEAAGATGPEKFVNLATARQNQSAFKPVPRSVEPLFNWLSGSIAGGTPGALGLGHSVGISTLPEDLSLNSGTHVTPNLANSGNSPSIPTGNPHFNTNMSGVPANSSSGGNTQYNIAKHLNAAEGNGEKSHRCNNNNSNMVSKHHQIQILSTNHNDSDDEENVDIESTVETEECSSTSSVWVSSTTAVGRAGGGAATPTHCNNNNSNMSNNNTVGFTRRRKRIAATIPCYSSGEDDVDEHDSDNQDDNSSTTDHYEEIRSSPGVRGKSGKRSRLWVNEIISGTDDDEDRKQCSGKGKGENKLHRRTNSPGRVLLESRE